MYLIIKKEGSPLDARRMSGAVQFGIIFWMALGTIGGIIDILASSSFYEIRFWLLGMSIGYLFFAFFSLYLLLKEEGKWLPVMWLSITSATLISETLKVIISRLRPYEILPVTPLSTHYSYSFPSGHMTLIFSIVALLTASSLAKCKEMKPIRCVWLGKNT